MAVCHDAQALFVQRCVLGGITGGRFGGLGKESLVRCSDFLECKKGTVSRFYL